LDKDGSGRLNANESAKLHEEATAAAVAADADSLSMDSGSVPPLDSKPTGDIPLEQTVPPGDGAAQTDPPSPHYAL
jgi:hypothetical protein